MVNLTKRNNNQHNNQVTNSTISIGILMCDHINALLTDNFGDYDTLINTSFSQYTDTHTLPIELKYYDVVNHIFPDDIKECDAYMTTGSQFSVNDVIPWINSLETFIQKLHHEKIPFIGICFGHQLIAKAFGGKVDQSNNGWGVGLKQQAIVKRKSWMQNYQTSKVNLLVSHQEQISKLPPSSELLLTSTFCPYAMFIVDDCLLGIQAHPEFTAEYSQALMEMRRNIIDESIISHGIKSLNDAHDGQLVIAWLVAFLQEKLG